MRFLLFLFLATCRASPALQQDIAGLVRTETQCTCSYPSDHRWNDLQRRSIAAVQSRSFRGETVHNLCAEWFPIIFQVVRMDLSTGEIVTAPEECMAGLLTACIVCAQSSAEVEDNEKVESMWTLILHALDFCMHCLDDSQWPFSANSVLANYADLAADPVNWRWRNHGLVDSPSLERMRFQLYWTKGITSEVGFWGERLSLDPEVNTDWGNRQQVVQWLATGAVDWYIDDTLCKFLNVDQKAPLRVLNSGSGPFSPASFVCSGASRAPRRVNVVSSDGLARHYYKLYDGYGYDPPVTPIQCPVEQLQSCFPPNHFDVAHMRNSLDHSYNPFIGILQLLAVTRPGGYVLLRHARNEGVPGGFVFGLHQWSFDIDDYSSSHPHFLIWNPTTRIDVTDELRGAAEVLTVIKPHPSPDAPPDERYIWVDIRKL